MYTYGFIGTGNMGGAVAKAVSKVTKSIILSNKTQQKAIDLAEALGCAYGDNNSVVKESEYIILGVKPQMLAGVVAELKPVLEARSDRPIIVTMAAGVTIEKLTAMLGGEYPIIRIMPNTPVSIGEGVIGYCTNELVTEGAKEIFVSAIDDSGLVVEVSENQIDALSAISGCGPAFVYMFIEALADGGVKCGLPRKLALELASKTVAGSGAMVGATGLHPGVLKDAVCSPGGTTIEGVATLEEKGMRGAIIDAVCAAFEKNAKFK